MSRINPTPPIHQLKKQFFLKFLLIIHNGNWGLWWNGWFDDNYICNLVQILGKFNAQASPKQSTKRKTEMTIESA